LAWEPDDVERRARRLALARMRSRKRSRIAPSSRASVRRAQEGRPLTRAFSKPPVAFHISSIVSIIDLAGGGAGEPVGAVAFDDLAMAI
jgi:hypothetical protein